MKFLTFDGGIHRFLERGFDLMLLNFLWILTCLPIFTIGAASTALYSVLLKMARNEEGYIFKNYIKAFKENFKRASLIWLCFLLILAWLVFMIRISIFSGSEFLKILALAEVAILLILVSALAYVFALQARYENTIVSTIQNAFILSLSYFPHSLALLLLWILPIVITAYSKSAYAILLFLWIFIGGTTLSFVSAKILMQVFEREEKKGENK